MQREEEEGMKKRKDGISIEVTIVRNSGETNKQVSKRVTDFIKQTKKSVAGTTPFSWIIKVNL